MAEPMVIDAKAAAELPPLDYEELRKLASCKMAIEAPGQTLQGTELAHEAWLRLTGSQNQKWDGRGHFFAAVTEAMRCILIDKARHKKALRHGGNLHRTQISFVNLTARAEDYESLAVNDTPDKYAAQDGQKAELVKLRYFAGMTIEQAADMLGISEPMAKRHRAYARAWLFREIKDERAKSNKATLSPSMPELEDTP